MPAAAAMAFGTIASAMVASDAADQANATSKQNAQLAADYSDPFHNSRAYWGDQLNQFMGKGGSQPLSYEDWAKSNGYAQSPEKAYAQPVRYGNIFGGGVGDALVNTPTQTPGQSYQQGQSAYQNYVKNFQPNSQLSMLQSSPGYQFRYNQGLNALNSSLAAKGLLNSGNRLAALTNYGQDYASNEYQNQYNRLASLSGASNANLGQAGANFGNISQQGTAYGAMGNASLGNAINQLSTYGANQLGKSNSGTGTGSYNFDTSSMPNLNDSFSGAGNSMFSTNTGGGF